MFDCKYDVRRKIAEECKKSRRKTEKVRIVAGLSPNGDNTFDTTNRVRRPIGYGGKFGESETSK